MRKAMGILLTILGLLPAGLTGMSAAGPAAAEGASAGPVTRLQGSVSLGRNRRVVGASVLVHRSDEASRLFVTASDSRGRFRVDGLTDGRYRVELRREGMHPVVKEDIGLRYPSRAVIEVLMEPVDVAAKTAVRPPSPEPAESAPRVTIGGSVTERGGGSMPDVVLRFVRPDGAADPVVVRSDTDGSFELPELVAGEWRLQTRVVGYLPIWISLPFREDTQLEVSMVRQPAGYEPSPLELMPPEQPIPPERFRSPTSRPAEPRSEATAEDGSPIPERDGQES